MFSLLNTVLKLKKIFIKGLKIVFVKDVDVFLLINSRLLKSLIFFFKTHSLLRFSSIIDLCVLDFMEKKKKTILIYNILSNVHNFRFFVCISLKNTKAVQSISQLLFGASWVEREAWDMFGIFFYNHKDLRRILTDYGFSGHPLRKDFSLVGYREVWFSEKYNRVLYVPLILTEDVKIYNFLEVWKQFKM